MDDVSRAPGTRPPALLERMDARLKIGCLAAWVVCVVTGAGQGVVLASGYAAALALLVLANRQVAARFSGRFATALPVIAAFGVFVPLFGEGVVVWKWGPLEVTQAGLAAAGRVLTAGVLCVAGVALVWASTPPSALLAGLRGVGVPNVLVETLGFMMRYLGSVRPALRRLTDARAARTIGAAGPNRLWSGAGVVGTLFLRSHDRAGRVADAMAARGYRGQMRALHSPRLRAGEVGLAVGFALLVIAWRVGGAV
jgi:cobalt/nickel transport system permease protein